MQATPGVKKTPLKTPKKTTASTKKATPAKNSAKKATPAKGGDPVNVRGERIEKGSERQGTCGGSFRGSEQDGTIMS